MRLSSALRHRRRAAPPAGGRSARAAARRPTSTATPATPTRSWKKCSSRSWFLSSGQAHELLISRAFSSISTGAAAASAAARLTTGQSAAPTSGPTAMVQPGNSAPAARRTSADNAPARTAAARRRAAPAPQSGNHRMRRDSEIDGEREQRVGEGVLAEQHAVADVDEQAEQPAGAQAHQPRLPHAPEDEHQRDEIGRQRDVVPRQEIRPAARARTSRGWCSRAPAAGCAATRSSR